MKTQLLLLLLFLNKQQLIEYQNIYAGIHIFFFYNISLNIKYKVY